MAFVQAMVHMKAAVFAKQGLELREVSQPQPQAGEALVRVRYAGLNRRYWRGGDAQSKRRCCRSLC